MTTCSVPGCGNGANLEVILYDFYPESGDVFFERDQTCPFICAAHAIENEQNAEGDRVPRGDVVHLYTNQDNAQSFTIYRPAAEQRR